MMRTVWACLVGLATFSICSVVLADDRAAIIDTARDTRLFLDELRTRGVQIVGRYYSRCAQPELGLTEKRLLDQGGRDDPDSEVRQLLDGGFAILSVYQYYNNHKNKFDGRRSDGKILRNADCAWDNVSRNVSEEATLDANAALAQAKAAGQPAASAIYFGVDFNFAPNDQMLSEKIRTYFKVINDIVGSGGYKIGAYGSGHANKMLRDAGLIEYSWISASRSFAGSTSFHRSGKWHLFQNQVDREWFGTRIGATAKCKSGLSLDVDVQNPAAIAYVGFWNAVGNGLFNVSADRTAEIDKSRKFACDGNSIIRHTASSSSGDIVKKRQCKNRRYKRIELKIGYANAVRIGSASGDLAQLDVDDDGIFDGWTWKGNLTANFIDKPHWIFSKPQRDSTKCP